MPQYSKTLAVLTLDPFGRDFLALSKQPSQISTHQEQHRPETPSNADIPTMDDLVKQLADWGLKVRNTVKELEEQGDIEAALKYNLEAQRIMANNFPSFLDTSPSTGSSGSVPRLAPSPIAQQQQHVNNNGNGAGMNGMPLAAGQQADVNFLFQKVVELSEVLKENREKTAGIIAGAEELAVSILRRSCRRSPSI